MVTNDYDYSLDDAWDYVRLAITFIIFSGAVFWGWITAARRDRAGKPDWVTNAKAFS
jgi:hypothetical protein